MTMTATMTACRDYVSQPWLRASPTQRPRRSTAPHAGAVAGTSTWPQLTLTRRVAAIEIKAGTAPTARDARHLTWLREELGPRFVRQILFNIGPQPFELGDRIWALPTASIWASHPTPTPSR